MPLTDSELLRRFAEEGHQDAFTELVSRRIDLVYAAALRQVGGDTHRAEDITQQVFIDLARKARSLGRHSSLLGWLYTSTHHAAVNVIRVEQRRKQREQEAHTMDHFTRPPARTADWEQLRPLLDGAMHELDDRDRQIVLMRFFDRQTFANIGVELGMTENAAQKSADRALDKLHGLLARRGITSTSTALTAALANQVAAAAPAGLASSIASTALAEAAMAAPSAGTLATIAHFMNTSKIGWGLAAILVLGVAGSIYFSRQVAHAETLLTAVERESAQLASRLREAAQRASTTQSNASLPAAKLAAPAQQIEASSPPPPSRAPMSAEQRLVMSTTLQNLASDPKFNELKIQFGATYLSADWALFGQSMGLTAEQRAQFERLLFDAIGDAWRVRMDARLSGRDEKDALTVELLNRARSRLEDGLKATLGEAGLQRFLDYERMGGVQGLTAQLAQRLYYTENPLSPQQATQLTETLAQHSPRFRSGRNASSNDIEWDRALPAVDSLLTPRQKRALELLRTERDFKREQEAAMKVAAGGTTK